MTIPVNVGVFAPPINFPSSKKCYERNATSVCDSDIKSLQFSENNLGELAICKL